VQSSSALQSNFVSLHLQLGALETDVRKRANTLNRYKRQALLDLRAHHLKGWLHPAFFLRSAPYLEDSVQAANKSVKLSLCMCHDVANLVVLQL